MPDTGALLRPRDTDALRAQIRWIAGMTALPVVFGGTVNADTLLLSEFVGARTNGLRGLSVLRTSGLGGQVMDSGRPASVADYPNAPTITHHYDAPVTGEGIQSVVAVPVVIADQPRAVLYCAARDMGPVGDRHAEVLLQAARKLGTEITIRDEVDRRLRLLDAVSNADEPPAMVAAELCGIHAELRGIAREVHDTELGTRLAELDARLTRATSNAPTADAPQLSRREADVLAEVALGCSNREVAQRLSLESETVKSYLRNVMTKLHTHSRHETVVTARRLGLLP